MQFFFFSFPGLVVRFFFFFFFFGLALTVRSFLSFSFPGLAVRFFFFGLALAVRSFFFYFTGLVVRFFLSFLFVFFFSTGFSEFGYWKKKKKKKAAPVTGMEPTNSVKNIE